jgi:hypothetical protein
VEVEKYLGFEVFTAVTTLKNAVFWGVAIDHINTAPHPERRQFST